MSRSFKKSPVWTENTSGSKRIANKRIRQAYTSTGEDDLSDGTEFKKFSSSYNIRDYRYYEQGDNQERMVRSLRK